MFLFVSLFASIEECSTVSSQQELEVHHNSNNIDEQTMINPEYEQLNENDDGEV